MANSDRTQKLTDGLIKKLPLPDQGNRIFYDARETGLGVRVTANGAKAFVLNYRTRSGRERRYTIGQISSTGEGWGIDAAREEAAKLKYEIDKGGDPLDELKKEREAPTVTELCADYRKKHLPTKRPKSQIDDQAIIEKYILPELKHRKVAEVTFNDIEHIHRTLSQRAPYRANRVVALLSKMFSLAIKWRWILENPCKGIEKNPEVKRQRYLTTAEIGKLIAALNEHRDKQAADIIRLLLLTGARRGEVLAMKWENLDLDEGSWTKPGATTKQKTDHRVPLSEAAVLLLKKLDRKFRSSHVFPSGQGHRADIKKNWAEICVAAGIVRTVEEGEKTILQPSARIHDLRHTYASMLASAGKSLPVIGALLGHTQAQTTNRYAHLVDGALRQATDTIGAMISGTPTAEIKVLRK